MEVVSFTLESTELEIAKNQSSIKDVLEFRGSFYTSSKAILDSKVIFKFEYESMI